MKVTVCFGNVRVIVPCGDGELLVKDLVEKAVARYRKATGKPNDTWVTVHSLQSSSDGGILDSDDCLTDVADDREQIIAIFEEQSSPLPHNAGDGTSGSSIGTESPDLFRGSSHDFLSKPDPNYAITDVEIPDNGLPLGITPLQVRRGSEPALNRLSPVISSSYENNINNNCSLPGQTVPYSVDPKRWSSAVAGIITEEDSNNNRAISKPDHKKIDNYTDELEDSEMLLAPPGDRGEGSGREESKSAFSRFSRDSVRLSMLSNDALTRWAEAADRQVMKMQSDARKEPVGGSATSPNSKSEQGFTYPPQSEISDLVVLKKEEGPLGIHVVPNYDPNGSLKFREGGLTIQRIENGGRIARDGRFQVGDKIIEINDESLVSVSFQQAQMIFKNALQTDELRLRLRKAPKKKPLPPPVLPKPHISRPDVKEGGIDAVHDENSKKNPNAKVATVSPTKKPNANMPACNTTSMLAANTRKIGRRIHIKLTKGNEGLGFSITTRDNPAGGNCPIYIKNILPKGAAIRDGRLKSGDRLLEVNDIEMTGKSQNEAVTILRNTPPGGSVDLVVSRQEIVVASLPEEPTSAPPNLPRQISSKHDENSVFPWKERHVLTFDIPLSDTGSAGLGISIKGKTSTSPNGSVDLGIFVKSVLHGGAASKDGRLRTNDQLVNVNGTSLLGVTNADAMETLRCAMCNHEGPNRDAITLTIARRLGDANDSVDSHNHTSNSDNLISFESPDTSENSENTVIFQPKMDNGNMTFETSKIEDKDLGFDTVFPNPVIHRLKGQTNSPARNDNYLRLGENNWGNKQLQQSIYGSTRRHEDQGSFVAPTINLPSTDTVMIEDPYGRTPAKNSRNRFSSRDSDGSLIEKRFPSRDDLRPDGGPASPQRKFSEDQDFTFVSQLSLNDDADVFARDGFGRQSMSEKRHAQLDAKNTDTFQRNKLIREERERMKTETDIKNRMEMDITDDRLKSATHRSHSVKVPNGNGIVMSTPKRDYGPSLGLKKSSSLESLHTLVHEVQKQEEDAEEIYARRGGRGRGCNESFRAAVDRSYEVPGHAADGQMAMETSCSRYGRHRDNHVDEESETGSNYGSYNLHHHHTRTAPGRVPAKLPHSESMAHDDMLNPYNREQNYGKNSKKKGLFKGIGHMFKFGKQKKGDDKQTEQEQERLRENERMQARRAAQDEQERIQEQYKILVERQKKMEQQNLQHIVVSSSQPSSAYPNSRPESHDLRDQMGSQSRQERIYQLRAQHQRKHQERQGQYPQDEQEEQYERQIQEQVDRQIYAQLPHKTPHHRRTQSHRNFQGSKQQYQGEQHIVHHHRSNSYDPLKEMERPGSRKGFADPSPGRGKPVNDQYNHYMNFEEIQYHMRQYQQNPHVQHQVTPNQKMNMSNYRRNAQNSVDRSKDVYHHDRHMQNHRSPLQAIETNSFPHSNNGTPYNRPPAPMPPGFVHNQRTPRHLPPEIPQQSRRNDAQNIYGRTPSKLPNQRQGDSQAPPTPVFQNVGSPSNYQNSSYGSSSNSRDSSNTGSKV